MFDNLRRFMNGHLLFKISQPRLRPLKKSHIRERLRDLNNYDDILRPQQQARMDAVNGDSGLSAGEQGKFEFAARGIAQHDQDRLETEARRELEAIDHRLKRLPPLPTVDTHSIMAVADARQTAFLISARGPLVDSKCAELRAGRGLTAFRRDNPDVQSRSVRSHNPLFVYPGILAVSAVEMWLNYVVLLGSGGHTGGEIVMLVVFSSLFNLLFGLLTGFVGVRNLGHGSERRKIGGLVALVVGAAFIIGLAFVMAHYRNAIDTAMDDPATVTNATLRLERIAAARANIRSTMRVDPFAFLSHLHAVLIFLLGLVFGTIAAFEGYYLLDDPYPGYGAADRLHRRARDGYQWEIRCFENGLAGIFQALIAQLDDALLRGVQRLDEIKSSLDAACGIIERFEKAASEVERAFFREVMEYRKEFRLVRDTQGPAHWNDDLPSLSRGNSFDLGNFREIEERVTADLQGLEDEIGQIKAMLARSQSDAASRMKAYLETVDKDAAREEDLALNDLVGTRMPELPKVDANPSEDLAAQMKLQW